MITGRDLIEKLYSEYEEEERTYSVEMDEETLSLFSDFCEEYGVDLKLYSKRDYIGLTKEAAQYLKNRRDRVAKSILKKRNSEGTLNKYIPNNHLNKENLWLSRIGRDSAKSDAKLYDDYVRKNKGKGKLLSPEEFLKNL